MEKEILNEQFRRMQKLAGIITEVKSDGEKEQKLKALVDFFSQGGTGDELRAIRDTYLHFKSDKNIESLEPILKNRYLKSPGIFNFADFTEEEFKEIVEKLAKIKNDESFLEAPSFNENTLKKSPEVEKIEMLFNQPTLKNALFLINSEQEYKDVIAALHLHFPDAFKKNMSVQAVSTRVGLKKKTPNPTAP